MSTPNNQKFMNLFNDILSGKAGNSLNKVLQMNTTKGDEVDVATNEKEQALTMRLDERNILFLKKVKEAKQKILDGTYGECEDCGDSISQKRLIARPTATMCIDCKEEEERTNWSNINKRRDLTNKSITEDNVGDHIKSVESYKSLNEIAFESVVDL